MRRLLMVPLLLLFFAMPSSAAAQASCDDFEAQGHAQFALDTRPTINQDALDPDGDGVACEDLPSSSGARNQTESPVQVTKPQDEEQSASTELTDQEQAYFDALVEDADLSGEVFEQVGQLFTQAEQDPMLILDQDWIIDLAAQLVQWQFIAEDAEDLEPSARQQHIHDLWMEINQLILLASDDITFGVDNIDPDSFESGSARIVYATLLVDDMTAAVLAFADDPNTPVEPENPIAPVLDCEPFPDYETAQRYYAAYPGEQPTLDPDLDGVACEVFFEME